MKQSTTNTLITAKAIYNETKSLINSENKHACTAGIILLQDCIELVVLAVLDELDVDEQKSLESKSFDELLGELKKNGVAIVKSGTIKALNKQRVISKHYGQLAEPASVVNYLNAADYFINSLINHIAGKPLSEILLVDLVNECLAKTHLNAAILLAAQNNYLEALIEIRKAFYVAYEDNYSIYNWRQIDQNSDLGLGLSGASLGGDKADQWKRNKQWIASNVSKPVEFIQINHERLKIDCMEWGLNTSEMENLRRLTPDIVQTENGIWHTDYDFLFPANEANSSNFNYCLDVIINFLLKMQEHNSIRKWPRTDKDSILPKIYIGNSIYEQPSQTSLAKGVVQENHICAMERIISGFNNEEQYQYISFYLVDEDTNEETLHFQGYLLIDESIG